MKGVLSLRKFIFYVITVALLVSLFSGLAIDNNAYAFTLITDAQESEGGAKGANEDAKTAMQKNAEACEELVEKTEISNDITEDDFIEMLYGACKYSAHKDYGTSIEMYEFEVKKATASKEGLLKAIVGFLKTVRKRLSK